MFSFKSSVGNAKEINAGQTVSIESEGQWHKTYDFIVEVLPTPIPHPVPWFLHAGERKQFMVGRKSKMKEKKCIKCV